jgi:hypothetical protein
MGMEVKRDQYDSGLIMPFFTMLSLTAIKVRHVRRGRQDKV